MAPINKLVVIGGVAGGATAAARARRLSESTEIVVFERGPYVSFANCGLPYHIGGEIADRAKLLLQTPESLNASHRLDVRVRTEVLAIDRPKKTVKVRRLDGGQEYDEPYDKLIIATGAAPIRPPLPGIDHPKIFTLRNVPDMDRIKSATDSAHSALVVGGGFIGLEMAENLRRKGLSVHLVEMLDQLMPPLDKEMAAVAADQLALAGIALHLSDAVESFSDAGGAVSATLKSGTTLTADLVILSIGVRPESGLANGAGLKIGERGGIIVDHHMQTSDPDIYAVGDAVITRDYVLGTDTIIPLAGPANRQGRIAADNVFGGTSVYRGSQGTSIVRVFNLVVGMTGASEKVLKKAGLAYEKVYLHPSHHVGYFPGAEQMAMKLLFAKPDGRVLGAQITGGSGVDKRIDVLATAIQARMTVFDLEEMELAYAPQFGSAKDPINMAGFVAANVLRGEVRIAHADRIPDSVLLDVRTIEEHEAGAIPGSIHIPIDDLRARHNELPVGKTVVAYCAVGQRGYTASRILEQLGHEVLNLSGGYRTYKALHPTATPTPAHATARSPGPIDPSLPTSDAANKPVALDVCGQQCPGPIVAVSQSLGAMDAGDVLSVRATDPGFVTDISAWCRQTKNELIEVRPENGHFLATIRKHDPNAVDKPAGNDASPAPNNDKTIVVFSSDLDRVMAALIIANGAASMGQKVTLFFTFWGLNVLRKPNATASGKTLLDRMFGRMMPAGIDRAGLSKMHMGGIGTALMRKTMRDKHVADPADLMKSAMAGGVRFVACAMSMDVMGIRREELIEGVEIGGVGSYLDAASTANVNLFI
jgi:NADPH-dependent 2,4-dienoyl-CoA reductase/sulfur reductase-like enzyme/peroxiredoxin family protein/rhodanese-related sulfurtransferase/TusA-related sulfurtransferase